MLSFFVFVFLSIFYSIIFPSKEDKLLKKLALQIHHLILHTLKIINHHRLVLTNSTLVLHLLILIKLFPLTIYKQFY
ncbi:hypothetical protein pb186bvf_000682 [Paramecium bursaria]